MTAARSTAGKRFWRIALTALTLGAGTAFAADAVVKEIAQQRMRMRPALPDTVQNPGFELSEPGAAPGAWEGTFHGGDRFRIETDASQAYAGKKSLIIENIGPTSWGGATQRMSASRLAGREVELSAWVKTKGVTAPGFHIALKITAVGTELAYVTSQANLTGDSEWKAIKLRTRVPQEATDLDLVLMLDGDGKAWVDEVRLELAPKE